MAEPEQQQAPRFTTPFNFGLTRGKPFLLASIARALSSLSHASSSRSPLTPTDDGSSVPLKGVSVDVKILDFLAEVCC